MKNSTATTLIYANGARILPWLLALNLICEILHILGSHFKFTLSMLPDYMLNPLGEGSGGGLDSGTIYGKFPFSVIPITFQSTFSM